MSGGAWKIARILERYVKRVVAVSPDDTGILDGEIAAVERLIARAALGSQDARRLMTVPGA